MHEIALLIVVVASVAAAGFSFRVVWLLSRQD